MLGQAGLFDVDERLKRLSDLGDPLLAFTAAVDFEVFRPELTRALAYSDGSQGGRPPFDPVRMFKILVIQAANTLSDERTEFLINDRLSFMRFLGLSLSDRAPDARTIWLFREKLTRAEAIKPLFDRFDAALREAGYVAMGGQIVDASLIAAPKQAQHRGGEEGGQGGAHCGGMESQAGQAPAQGSRRALDGQVQQGQGEAGWDGSSGRHRHSDVRLPEPCLDRPRTWADPALGRDRRCGLRGRATA